MLNEPMHPSQLKELLTGVTIWEGRVILFKIIPQATIAENLLFAAILLLHALLLLFMDLSPFYGAILS